MDDEKATQAAVADRTSFVDSDRMKQEIESRQTIIIEWTSMDVITRRSFFQELLNQRE